MTRSQQPRSSWIQATNFATHALLLAAAVAGCAAEMHGGLSREELNTMTPGVCEEGCGYRAIRPDPPLAGRDLLLLPVMHVQFGAAGALSPRLAPAAVSAPDPYLAGPSSSPEGVPLAVGHFMQLADAAWNATGRRIGWKSGYRDFARQCAVFRRDACDPQIGLTLADRGVARPGHSEHQLGTAVDIFVLGEDELWRYLGGPISTFQAAAEPDLYAWMDEHAHQYGFINSYPPNDDDERFSTESARESGYGPEPWHWRFVGLPAAAVHRRLHLESGQRWTAHRLVGALNDDDWRMELGVPDIDELLAPQPADALALGRLFCDDGDVFCDDACADRAAVGPDCGGWKIGPRTPRFRPE